jgi:hypothetical protein
MGHMKHSTVISPGHQRLFQDGTGRCVLLHKTGIAVSFWLDENDTVRLVDRMEGIDFKETGNQLIREGWKCIGPGMDYAGLWEKTEGQ